jgi:Rrf2 family nitric oxide-sensitive transcriptional repressor
MQLTMFSDYALRVALYLATHQDELVSVPEVSRAYGISSAHLTKVAQRLTELGLVEAVRGRGGGLRLARAPEQIGVGALVRATEPHFDLVECFDPETNTCPISAACGLKGALEKARRAFLEVLDGYTLADFVRRKDRLIPLWVGSKAR